MSEWSGTCPTCHQQNLSWQPIETAPKGVAVLLYFPTLKPHRGSPLAAMMKVGLPHDIPRQATHWMPLTPPPKDIQGDDKP